MKRIWIAVCFVVAGSTGQADPGANPFKSETECYAFLSGLQDLMEAYSGHVSGIKIPPEGTEMFDSIREPLQAMVNLQRDVAAECVLLMPE